MSDDPLDELAAATRRLIEAVRTYDGPETTAAAASARIDELVAELEPHLADGPYMQGAVNMESMSFEQLFGDDPHTIFPYSPVIGARNPLSPPAHMWVDDEGHVHAEVTVPPQHAGPPDSVHGGVIALLFDELLGVTGVVNQSGAHTGTLEVVYRSLTPQGRPLRLQAWIDRIDGRKVYIRGQMHHEQTLCAEASGIFVRPSVDFLD